MSGDFVQQVSIKVRSDGTLEIKKVGDELDNVGKKAREAGSSSGEGFGKMVSGARSVVTELAALVGISLTAKAAVDAIFAGINKADTLRDVAASITAVSKSREEAVAALAYFDEAQKRTRLTGDDLARFYATQLPLALRAGFSPENFRTMVVNVAQFATAIGKPIESIMQEFEHLLSGRIRAQNSDILAALGLGPKDLALGRITLQGVIQGMQDLTKRAGDMGQSFESMKAKVKDALLDAFANGFNRARGDAEAGMKGILDAINDPQLIAAIGNIGEAVGKLFGPISEGIKSLTTQIDLLVKHAESKAPWQERLKAFAQDLTGFGPGLSGLPNGVSTPSPAPRWGSAPGSEFDQVTASVERLVASVKGLKNTIISPEVEAFNKELGALVMTGTDVDRQMRVLEAAIKVVDGRLGEGAGARAFNSQLQALETQAIKVGKTLKETLLPILQAKPNALGDLLVKAFNVPGDKSLGIPGGVGITAQEIAAEQTFFHEQAIEMKALFADIFKDIARQFREEFQANFKQPLADIFTDLALTGGRNFGAIAANVFGQDVQKIGLKFASDVGELLSNAVFGQVGYVQGEGYTFGGQTGLTQEEADAAKGKAQAGLGQTIGTVVGAVAQSANPKTSDAAAAIGAAAAGYSVALTLMSTGYGVIAGIIVAAATYAVHLFAASPGSTYQYATGLGTNAQGVFGGNPNKNIDKNTWANAVAAGQAAFDQFYDGYLNLTVKLTGIAPKISMAFGAVYGEFEKGADLGKAASEKFGQELEAYLKTGLPHQIADRFSTVVSAGFVKLGFSGERFAEIWGKLSTLDPAKALALLNDLADAAISFAKSLAFFKTPYSIGWTPTGASQWGAQGMLEQVAAKDAQTFAQSLQESDDKIVQLSASLAGLSLEGQIAGFKQIASLMEDRYNKEVAYLQKINQTIRAISASIEKQASDIRLAGMLTPEGKPDVQAQTNYLFSQLQVAGQAIQAATSPEMVQAATQHAQDLIGQILQIGGAQGPEALKLYQAWALDQLAKLEDVSTTKLNSLGQELQDANTRLVTAIEGFITAFETATTHLTDTTPGGGPGDTPTFDPGPIVYVVKEGNTTLTDIRDILKAGQNIKINLSDHDVNVHVDLNGGASRGGDTGNLAGRVLSGRS